MENNEKEILDLLKDNLLMVNQDIKDTDSFFGYENAKSEYKDYYLIDFTNNLYQSTKPAFELGTGLEAVRSSAAMIYNTIGTDSIIIDNKKYKLVKYEDVLDGLKGRQGPHLDVSLENNEERLFIEAKCLEWINEPEKLINSYLNVENYYDQKEASHFIPIFKMLIEDSNIKKEKYNSIYKHYNSKQMTIHILGIYHWCKKNLTTTPKTVKLLNIVWDYDTAEQYKVEEKEGLEYTGFANIAFRNLFKDLGIDFTLEYIRYSDFLNRVDWTNDLERRNYLRRYEIKETISNNDFNKQFKILWKKTKHKNEDQTTYISRVSNDPDINLPIGAFNKEESSKRYNPKENESSYTKDQLLNIKNEKWVLLSNQYYTKYAVSSEGRVAFLDKDNLYHILKQDDDLHKYYLRLDPDGEYPVDHQIEVYKLIAMGFLGKKIGDSYDVHHIINDGYNCRENNLLLLTRTQHNFVHSTESKFHEIENNLDKYIR